MAAMIGALLLISICTLSSSSPRGYILKVPRVLNEEATNSLYLALYDVNSAGQLSVKLLKNDNDTVIAEQTVDIEAGTAESTIQLYVPGVDDFEARLQISGKFDTEDNYEIFGEDTVSFKSSRSQFIFIQTDKPLYKPGQEVKFRVLSVDESLKPMSNLEGSVWVEDPDRAIVAQWKNVSFGNGLKQFELPLSEEPKLGLWNIFASMNGTEEVASFEVKEYVLPKFEVVIEPPSYVLANSETIPIKICAKYTYGKLVEGTLKFNASIESYSWAFDKLPVLQEEEEKLDGCHEYALNVSLIDNEYQYHYRRIEIFAEVTEKGTDISRNATVFIDRVQTPLMISFKRESEYFKPGLPYHGVLEVLHPDRTPAEGEPFGICMTVSRERMLSDWWATREMKNCRNFTSDAAGKIRFTVPPLNTDAISLNIEARSLKYHGDRPAPRLYKPQTSMHARPWYSPSGSYLQIQGNRDRLPCNTKKDIQVFFTSKDDGDYRFYYEVVNKGKVIEGSFVDASFVAKDDITEDWSDTLVNEEMVQIFPATDNKENAENDDNNCKAITDTKYVPPVGAVNISVDVSALLSPDFHLLVYYVKDDRETVSDSKKFSVEKCFMNKVSLEFGDESVQPGTRTSLTLSASPNSLCGLKVVDKSVTLLDSSEQLTKDKVYERLSRYDHVRYYSRNHCNDKKQPGTEKLKSGAHYMPPRPPGWSSSAYEDALTAFETSGFIVISDLVLLTRPCKSSGPSYTPMRTSGFSGASAAPGAPVALATSRRPAAPRPPAVEMADAEMAVSRKRGPTKSAVDIRNFFPETWLFDIEQVDDEGKLITKKVLPHTITEWIGSAVCINEEDGLGISDTTQVKGFQAFFMTFTLPYSVIRGEKVPLIVSTFNYLDKCLPVSLELLESAGYDLLADSPKTEICVCGGKSENHRFHIKPTSLGSLNLTVIGKTADSPDICGSSEVTDAVARDAVTRPLLVEAEGFPYEKVSTVLFCPKELENGRFKRSLSYDLPDDVVEDSARGFFSVTGDIMGPTIQGLDKLVQMPTGCGEQNIVLFAPNVYVLDYLGAIGEVPFKIKNKAIRNLQTGYQRQLRYRREDNSYSAFGNTDKEGSLFLTAFVLGTFSQASKYINIDANELEQSRNWILSKQREDGCFPEVGRTLSQSLKGGVQDENVSTSLTAYVLISLLSSGMESGNVTNLALSCLETEDNLTPYKAALFAYASALAGNKEKTEEYMKELNSKADSRGDQTFWHDKEDHVSVQVEIAAYAVLTNLKLGKPLQDSLPIVKWMNSNRNSNGGFVSTQDTVLGLEALSKFAPLISKNPVDLEITASDKLEEKIRITNDDRLLLRNYKLSSVPGEVSVEASGSGCGLIQGTVRCNTLTSHKNEYFSLELSTTRTSEDQCDHATIRVCARYLQENEKSNMALIEIKMVSGYVPVKETLEKLRDDPIVELKRFEVDNNNVVFYFDELSGDTKCFSFAVEQLIDVEDTKPATARVYDYYATEREQESLYTIGDCQ